MVGFLVLGRRPDVAGLLAVAVGVTLGSGVSLLPGASLGNDLFVVGSPAWSSAP